MAEPPQTQDRSELRTLASGSRATLQADTEDGDEGSDDMEHLLRAVAAAPNVDPVRPAVRLEPGDVVGDTFEIEEQVGEGGMGVVYRAIDTSLDRRVAIKIHVGQTSEQGVQRLLREAKVMARLSHPNVVTVYEVGMHNEYLFIAMEYVDGGSVREWIARERPGWSEICAVFAQAGHGLAAAHDVGLIHRDFKPDNILVDASRRARVADFGLARVAEATDSLEVPPADAATLDSISLDRLTKTGATVGTPGYMAPEQYGGESVGAASDQFAFCVSMFEALFGRRPHKASTIHELMGAVALEEVVDVDEGSVPAHIGRVLRRGLRARPADRFPSMAALLAELARDPGARRRRVLGGFAAVGAASVAIWAATRTDETLCTGAEQLVAEVWDDGARVDVKASFEASGGVSDPVLGALDDFAQRWAAEHYEACAATQIRGSQSEALMDRKIGCLSTRLSLAEGQIRVLRRADEAVVARSNDLIGALPDLHPCQDGERLLVGVAPPDAEIAYQVDSVRATLSELGALAIARKPKDAEARLPAVLEEAGAIGYEPLLVEAHHIAGQLVEDLGQIDAAEQYYDDALWGAVQVGYDELVSKIAYKLAFIVGYKKGNNDEGRRLLRFAEAAMSEPPDDDLLANITSIQGALATRIGDHETAVSAYRRAVELNEARHGPEDPRVGDALVNLAIGLDNLGRNEETLAALTSAIRILELHKHPNLGQALRTLGIYHCRRRDTLECIEALGRALKVDEEAIGMNSVALCPTLRLLAVGYSQVGQPDKAEQTLTRAIEIFEKGGGANAEYAQLLRTQGSMLKRQGRCEEAIPLFEKGNAVLEEVYGPKYEELARALADIAGCQRNSGHLDLAAANLQHALEIAEDGWGPESTSTAEIHLTLASVLMLQGDVKAAMQHAQRGVGVYEEAGALKSNGGAHALARRAEVHEASGDLGAAAADLQRAVEYSAKEAMLNGMKSSRRLRLAEVLRSLRREDEARKQAEAGLGELPQGQLPQTRADLEAFLAARR